MTCWIFETDLMWGPRIRQTLEHLGWTGILTSVVPDGTADCAIVNLGSKNPDPTQLVSALKERGVYTIAHAGHKETELRELGLKLNVNKLATNGELTYKLDKILPHRP